MDRTTMKNIYLCYSAEVNVNIDVNRINIIYDDEFMSTTQMT